jgi:hypothetical protein
MEPKYKSNRSEKFRKWVETLDDDKIKDLVDLERYARLVVHYAALTGDLDPKAIHGLARAQRTIQVSYESAPS